MFSLSLVFLSVLLTGWIAYNVRGWPHASLEDPASYPFVSILVPARNEERGIRRCLESLLRQDYPHFEVLCLDDRSEDATRSILEELNQRYPQLKILQGGELPPAWAGKCHACHQLSEAASGDWLLFTDADTIHAPNMVRRMIATAQEQGASLLTGFPRVWSSHAFGWLIVPMLFFVIALHLPLRLVTGSADPRFMAAHGAFLLFRREDYFALGGHAAYPREIVEDMALARGIKRSGKRAVLTDITPYVTCDMYERPADVWNGFTKNLFLGLGRSTPLLALLLLFYSVCYIWPLVGIILYTATGTIFAAVCLLVCYLLMCMQKWIVDRAFGTRGAWFLLLPLSFLGLIFIALRSWYIDITNKGYAWKGRIYRHDNHS